MFHFAELLGLSPDRRNDVDPGQESCPHPRDPGQAIIEYVLIVGTVSVALIVAVAALTGNLSALYDTIIAAFAALF